VHHSSLSTIAVKCQEIISDNSKQLQQEIMHTKRLIIALLTFICYILHVICHMLHAIYYMLYTTCCMLYTIC